MSKNATPELLLPRISIVTPSYNQAQFLEETIRSVLSQEYPNLQYIIIDGNSSDNSVEIIKKYESSLSYWVSEPDDGQTYAIQKGMQFATGEIVNWLNSDDFLLPGALFHIAEIWQKNRALSVFCGNAIVVDTASNQLSQRRAALARDTLKLLPDSPPVQGGVQASWFMTKDLWDLVGGVDVILDYTMDTELYYRCYKKNAVFLILDCDIAAYRFHEETKTKKGWTKSIDYKKLFYLSRCSQLTKEEQSIYLPRIRRFLCVLCIKSISPKDNFLSRLKKVFRAMREAPEYFFVPYRVKMVVRKLITGQ